MEEQTKTELQEKVAANRELEKQLTKKNDQFIFDMKKLLSDADFDEEKKVVALNDMLIALVNGQKTGATAKQLYGTPTEAAQLIVEAKEPLPEMTFGKMWLDNTLMLFVFLAVMTGTFSMISKNAQATQGVLSILIGAMSGGLSFYMIYKYIYVYDLPGADQSKRPGVLKSGLIMALCFIPWLLVFSFAALIPSAYNPSLDPTMTIALGVAAYGVRYLLKKQFGIQGNLFMRR
ncbi:MAG: DUF1129 domain-containing protein [Vagococcus sp.]